MAVKGFVLLGLGVSLSTHHFVMLGLFDEPDQPPPPSPFIRYRARYV